MINTIKKNLFMNRLVLLLNKGLADGRITKFDDEIYDKLSHMYISSLPASIYIKYLFGTGMIGKCYDSSLYMFFCFDDAVLVRGDNKDLEFNYGKDQAGHGWIEIGDYVYDASTKLKVQKDLYYEMYKPTNVVKITKEEYCSDPDCKELYESVRSTTLDDYRNSGLKRFELLMIIPYAKEIAYSSNNQEFINELNQFLSDINYNEEEISKDLQDTALKI